MKVQKFFLLFIFIFLVTILEAQPLGSLTGTVTDKNTLQPVPGASVKLSNGQSIITDSAGRFSFTPLAVGTYGLTITSIGYKDNQLFNLVITSGNDIVLNIEMETLSQELSGVTVQSNRATVRAATLESPL